MEFVLILALFSADGQRSLVAFDEYENFQDCQIAKEYKEIAHGSPLAKRWACLPKDSLPEGVDFSAIIVESEIGQ